MSKMVAFKANDEEATEIDTYSKARHFRTLPDFARFAVFAYMRQNKPGGHRTVNGSKSDGKSGRGAPPTAIGEDS